MSVHFKMDERRGLCMTQHGGSKHFPIGDYHPVVGQRVSDCLNECFNEWEMAKVSEDVRRTIEEAKRMSEAKGGAE